jgi:hypothetical protein
MPETYLLVGMTMILNNIFLNMAKLFNPNLLEEWEHLLALLLLSFNLCLMQKMQYRN